MIIKSSTLGWSNDVDKGNGIASRSNSLRAIQPLHQRLQRPPLLIFQ